NVSHSYAAADNVPLNTGEWHHITVCYDGSKNAYNMMRIFIDGKPISLRYKNEDGMLPASTPTDTASFELGSNGFNGKLDDVRLWDETLEDSQLDYKITINKYHAQYNNLTAYWKTDEESDRIHDEKGNF